MIFLLTIPLVATCPAQGVMQEIIKSNNIDNVKRMLETSPTSANACLDGGANCTKPIHLAVQLGLVEMAETLIKYGAKVNTRVGDDQMSPLDLAANSGNIRLMQVLLANQAEVNTEGKIIRGPGYVPPLSYAVLNNHIGAMILLLESGAKVNFEISIELNSDSIRRGKSSTNLGRGNSLMYLNLANSAEAAEVLIAYGIKIRKSDEWGKTHKSVFADVPPSQISAFIGEFIGNKKQRPTPAEIKERQQVASNAGKQENSQQRRLREIIPNTITTKSRNTETTTVGVLYQVKVKGKWGYIDRTGRMVIELQSDKAGQFSEGLAAVRVNGKLGYIDHTGQMVIASQFDDAYGFSEGMAAVRVSGKLGYIDRTGLMAIASQFDDAYGFSEGLALVRINGKWGYIDRTGKAVWSESKNDVLATLERQPLDTPKVAIASSEQVSSSPPVPNVGSCFFKLCAAYMADQKAKEELPKIEFSLAGVIAFIKGGTAAVGGVKLTESALVDCFPERSNEERSQIQFLIFLYLNAYGSVTSKKIFEIADVAFYSLESNVYGAFAALAELNAATSVLPSQSGRT